MGTDPKAVTDFCTPLMTGYPGIPDKKGIPTLPGQEAGPDLGYLHLEKGLLETPLCS